MSSINRRNFLKAGAASSLLAASVPHIAHAKKSTPHIVVIGGGFGGATCAKYLSIADPSLKITLIEKNKYYYACPGSNDVIADIQPMDFIKRNYDSLRKKYSVNVIHATVNNIDAEKQTITSTDGQSLSYDRLVVSPGIDFKWGEVEGYDEKASESIPHAWKAGPQTVLLRDQLLAMKDGGTVIIAPPKNPFRCPPGPYERASLIAHYLKQNKPKSKIVILDSKSKFSKQRLFTEGWDALYPGMIEWVSSSNDGKVNAVDVANKVAITEFAEHKADVLNVIPAQKAGYLAHKAGLTNAKGWCPVDQQTFESTLIPNIHVIGDASIAGKMPKSGYAANTQAKVCAFAVANLVKGQPFETPAFLNTCYSFIGPHYGISVAAVYEYSKEKQKIISTSAGVSPKGHNSALEAVFAENWHKNIAADIFY